MTTAPGEPISLKLLIRAAVRVSFDLATFAPTADLDDLMTFLDSSAERVRTPSGKMVWSLADSERRRCFADVPIDRLRVDRANAPNVEESLLQETLDRSLGSGWSEMDLAVLSPAEARALSVVAGWWQGHRPKVPDPITATMLVDRLNLFADLTAMANDHFIGRAGVIDDLRHHFSTDGSLPFAVYGVGGIGKSALIARHVVWAIDEVGGGGAYAAALDFDDPTLNPNYALDIVHRIVRIVGLQASGPVRERLERLTTVALDAAETNIYRGQTSSRAADGQLGPEIIELLGDLVAFSDRPVLVVFDTVEQVQRRGSSAVATFNALVFELGRFGNRVRVLISGRVLVPRLPVEDRELAGLDRQEAITLFAELCSRTIEPAIVEAVIDALGTSPLTVRLAARLISEIETSPGDLIALDLQAERINAELYCRVLEHIRDKAVQRLAHPGLVLRRITSDIIRVVLSGPCKVPVPDMAAADDLFDRLAREAMLVDQSPDGQTLIHRADIRRVMLPQLLADRRDVADQIQRSAVHYYAGRTDSNSRIEELYHRLMLGEDAATLTTRWDQAAAESLYDVLEELPTASRIYLSRGLRETYLSEEDRRLIDDSEWLTEVQPQVARLISAGDPTQALERLHERRGPHGDSLLPDLEIEALEATGDLYAATAIARDERRAAAIANDSAAVAAYTLHLARLLERDNEPEAAVTVLEEALSSVKAPTISRLRLLVAILGLWRRQPRLGESDRAETYAAEAVNLHEVLDDREQQRVPGLLRDLAAEVSVVQSAILDEALRTIGVDASPDGLVPDALRDLDDSMAAKHGTPGLVADLAQIGRSNDEVSWEEITVKPRGETGRALLEVLSTFGSSADQLRSAVTADYQQEADAALLGFEFNVDHKR